MTEADAPRAGLQGVAGAPPVDGGGAGAVQDAAGAPSGLALAESCYREVVAPLVLARWPDLPHAGARLGGGSDVLGLDDATSRDHDWGLRLTLLVDPALVAAVDAHLTSELPEHHRGWPTRFAVTGDARLSHRVEVASPEAFTTAHLGVAPSRAWTALDWLSLTGQSVLEVTAGSVFTDSAGDLTRVRQRLAWYPSEVERWVLAAAWHRLGVELPLVARTGERGDDLGSRLVAAHLVEVAVHLALLLHRRWPPYRKWRGTALAALPGSGPELAALARGPLLAVSWEERQDALVELLTALHRLQGEAGLPCAPHAVEPF